MSTASRSPHPAELTFRNEVWTWLPQLASCLWYYGGGHKDFAENVLEYIKYIRVGLDKMEQQIKDENKKSNE